ncbi:MAG TPA: hypothetical protein VN317_08960 [Candidatus Methanoperedens sp.]|nr:hypothetical protein [Candidatus Methanoperedens sp.]
MIPGGAQPDRPALVRAARLLTKARDAFYERRYEECIERCQETLGVILPPGPAAAPDGPPPMPEELADRFLAHYAGLLPLVDAERIAGVFTFFLRRKARFGYERGRSLPRRDWWEFLQISRGEAGEVLAATRRALESVQRGGPPPP